MLYITAFLTGLMSSFHCAGMCGPIVMSLPGFGQLNKRNFIGRLLYQLGRIFTYVLIGFVFGAVGLGFKWIGFQQSFSIGIGVLLLLLFVLKIKIDSVLGFNIFKKISQFLSLQNKSQFGLQSFFMVGVVNGFLPCGFVYFAAMGASVVQSSIEGMALMALFGLGTLPVMLPLSILGQLIPIKVRNKVLKFAPYMMLLMGLLFILRGLNLGIPYVSPYFENNGMVDHNCK